jgi:hypothetical protein
MLSCDYAMAKFSDNIQLPCKILKKIEGNNRCWEVEIIGINRRTYVMFESELKPLSKKEAMLLILEN